MKEKTVAEEWAEADHCVAEAEAVAGRDDGKAPMEDRLARISLACMRLEKEARRAGILDRPAENELEKAIQWVSAVWGTF